jgi:hypothetical protein
VLLIGGREALRYSADASAVQRIDATGLDRPSPGAFRRFDLWQDATWDRGERVIPYVRQVLGMDNRPVSLIRVNVRESLFRKLYQQYERARGSQYLIVNDRGVIQSCADEALYGKNLHRTLKLPEGLMTARPVL